MIDLPSMAFSYHAMLIESPKCCVSQIGCRISAPSPGPGLPSPARIEGCNYQPKHPSPSGRGGTAKRWVRAQSLLKYVTVNPNGSTKEAAVSPVLLPSRMSPFEGAIPKRLEPSLLLCSSAGFVFGNGFSRVK